jgi:hypothetical protein
MNGEYAAGYEEGFQAGKNWGLSLNNDDLETLRQENAALREKLDFHTKLQPMDTAPKDKHFILKAQQKDGWVDFYRCYWREDSYGFYIDEGGTEVSKQEFNLLGWLPLPEGTEGL